MFKDCFLAEVEDKKIASCDIIVKMRSREITPLVAVDVAIFREREGREEILLGKRKGETAASGQWNLPGGHVKMGERLGEAAGREVREELGEIKVDLSDKVIGVVQNNLPPDYLPHVVIVLEAKHLRGEPSLMEPDKCEEWSWFLTNQLPQNTFAEVKQILANRSSNRVRIGTNWEKRN